MVFQKSNPFPKTIAENIAYGLRIGGVNNKAIIAETIEASLQLAESALVGLGVPMGLVIASVHERREAVRRELQAAAGSTSSITERIRQARRDRPSRS